MAQIGGAILVGRGTDRDELQGRILLTRPLAQVTRDAILEATACA